MAEGTTNSAPKLAAKKRRLVVESDTESEESDLSLTSSPSRWAAEEIKNGGQHKFQDLAEVYGHQIDGLDETWDDDTEVLGESAFCTICDDGGRLLFCDGPCMRSFHASKESATKSSKCKSLGLMEEDVEKVESWYCPNCKHGQQQCFICGVLGRSEGEDKQVFVCDVALCGRFYHLDCLGDWNVHQRFNRVDRRALIKRVKEGEGFCCPAHNCRMCGAGEEEGDSMRLAKCRRCPKAFHERCLPKKHEIDENLKTPDRNHLKWPEASSLHRNSQNMKEAPSVRQNHERRTETSLPEQSHQNTSKSPSANWSYQKLLEDPSLDIEMDLSERVLRADRKKRSKFDEKEAERTNTKFSSVGEKDRVLETPTVLLKPYGTLQIPVKATPAAPNVCPQSTSADFRRMGMPEKKTGERYPPVRKIFIPRDAQRARISLLMQQAANYVTLEDVRKVLVEPICYRENREKNHFHRGEIMSTLNAGRKALAVLRNGGRVEDAKLLCSKDSFIRLLRTEKTLGVYLAPLLHGLRYTSYGRHFTRIDKLQEIVDRIHPYIDSGDMVVDFCCGANDFSILLNKKLMTNGKRCEFRNFDIHPPKDKFCFTQGDWFQNGGHGFFEGRRLVIGLNPPFGSQASLADKFILHALKFKPKLLVLIVPPETMSFSERYKHFNYELVWMDDKLLSGKAFFIPGSVGEKDTENMFQWNNVTPPLFLWSRGDLIRKHKEIAFGCGHITGSDGGASGLHLRKEPQQQHAQREGLVVTPGFRSHLEPPFSEGLRQSEMTQHDVGWGTAGWLP